MFEDVVSFYCYCGGGCGGGVDGVSGDGVIVAVVNRREERKEG